MEDKVDIVAVSEAETERAIAVLTAGFVADPFIRWIFPDVQDFLAHYPGFVRYLVRPSCQAGGLFAEKNFGAAAAWLRPGVEPEEQALGRYIDETVCPEIRDAFYAAGAQMAEYHHRAGPCWYLPAIAADPTRQGQGLGSALMKHALEACDEEGTNAYLECSNAANIPLYQRHGFEIVGEIQVGSSPTTLPMVRPAR